MNPCTPKPRGRKQDRPSKDKLIGLIAQRGPQTVAELSKATGIAPRCVRRHLDLMRTNGETFRVDGTSPTVWAIKPIQAEDIPSRPKKIDMDGKPVRVIRPAGTWERQYRAPVASSSIFSMGGA